MPKLSPIWGTWTGDNDNVGLFAVKNETIQFNQAIN